MILRRPKIALALGGGGARGMAHIGVIKVLEAEHIPIDLIAGTSIGALVGGCYAQHPDAQEMERRVVEYIESAEFKKTGLERFRRREPAENFFGQVAQRVRERIVINLAQSRLSVVGLTRMNKVVEAVLNDAPIEETEIPLLIVATDLIRGADHVFRQGSIRKAALASAAIPGFLPPVQANGGLLVDGAVTSPVPVLPAREAGADIIIAVDVGQDLPQNPEVESIIDVMFRTNSITSNRLKHLILEQADVVVRPQVGHIHWADFGDVPALIRAGEAAVRKKLPEIRRVLKERQPFWQKWFGRSRENQEEESLKAA